MTSVVETALVPDAAAMSPPRSATQARSGSASLLDPAAGIRDLPLLVTRSEPAPLPVSSCSVPDPSTSSLCTSGPARAGVRSNFGPCYRFAKKLREHKPLLDACLDRVVASLREHGPRDAIDATDMPAYAKWAEVRRLRRAAQAVQRPRRRLGLPLRCLDSARWRFLRVQAAHCRLRQDRPS